MRLSQFIEVNVEPILEEWEAFARTMLPPASTMSMMELRDHAQDILLWIAAEMETPQSAPERHARSLGNAPASLEQTFPSLHGVLRQRSGFDLVQLGAEYRALRAAVLRLWRVGIESVDADMLEQVMRFNEGIDQGMAESMAAYSERVSNSRDTFLAVLGHDLRNPLNALGTCVQLLGQSKALKSRETTFLIAKRSLVAINGMVTDLLEYTRTRLGQGIAVVPVPGNFAALSQEAFDEVCSAYPQRTLAADIPDVAPLMFDAARMRQVIVNLLSNAVQHSDARSAIGLAVRDADEWVTLVVRNDGPPIPPEAMQVIFTPPGSTAQRGVGAGRTPREQPGAGPVHRSRDRHGPRRAHQRHVFRRRRHGLHGPAAAMITRLAGAQGRAAPRFRRAR